METAYEYINDLIKIEKNSGIPDNRIIIGELYFKPFFYSTMYEQNEQNLLFTFCIK